MERGETDREREISRNMSRIIVPYELDQETIGRKVAKLITTIIEAANGAQKTRCEAMMIESGCSV